MCAQVTATVELKGGSFFSYINGLAQVIKVSNELKLGDTFTIDLHKCSWILPTFILPLAGLIDHLKRMGLKVELVFPQNENAKTYLSSIHFPDGIGNTGSWWETLTDWEHYSQSTYIPITRFNTNIEWKRIAETTEYKDFIGFYEQAISKLNKPYFSGQTKKAPIGTFLEQKIQSSIQSILKNYFNAEGDLRNILSFLTAETLDNIEQHASAPQGWIHLQAYPKYEHIDISISDFGITLFGGYKAAGFDEVKSDADAMLKAMNGQSIKEKDGGRGFGIRKSRKLLCRGLGGEHLIWSGKSIAYWDRRDSGDKILDLPDTLRYPGTLVCMRIPSKIPDGFSFYRWME